MNPADDVTREEFQAPQAQEGEEEEVHNNNNNVHQPDEADDDAFPSFFEEADECFGLLERLDGLLPADRDVLLPSVGQDPDGVAALVEVRLAKILSRYQENPHILMPYLERLMSPLVDLLLRYLPPAAEAWAALTEKPDPSSTDEKKAEEESMVIKANVLGQNFDMFDSDAPKTPLHLICRGLYTIIKTAGEKCCTSYFPNEVKLYEDVFYTAQWWRADPRRQREWEVRYCLLLWLSNLVLVPFSLGIIDTNDHLHSGSAASTAGLPLSDAVLAMAASLLADTSKCRDGAALLVARLLTRPDSQRHRDLFFDYARGVLSNAHDSANDDDDGGNDNFLKRVLRAEEKEREAAAVASASAFRLPGVLLAIAKTLKLGKREELVQYATAGLMADIGSRMRAPPVDTLLCKCGVKVIQRLVLASLPKRRAAWRYQRHMASLASNLGADDAAKRHDDGGGNDNKEDEEEDEAVIEGDEECVEEGIGILLESLGHKDTVVRWSAAKGVGRVCERLPQEMAQEVVAAAMESFAQEHNDSLWHGGLLALAELCRRGILSTALLAGAVAAVAKGLAFDLSKGTYSVGAHVRDAACYVCWSIARAYDAADIEPHVHRLSAALVVTSLFDREVNVRRAAAAAFQECVGRLGNFPNGIDLVTTMDFFSLSSLANAYGEAASKVARFPAYRPPMLEELVAVKLSHWDRQVRAQAAAALGRLSVLEPQAVTAGVLPELLARVEDPSVAVRHGAILGLASIVDAMPSVEAWTEGQREDVVQVIVRLDGARLFRSRGAEYVRQACCELLCACARRRLALPEVVTVTKLSGAKAKARTHAKVQEFFEDTWSNILEWVQASAARAFAVYAAAYYTAFHSPFHHRMLAKMIAGCQRGGHSNSVSGGGGAAQSPLARRGFLAAAGGIPAPLLCARTEDSASGDGEAAAAASPSGGGSSCYYTLVMAALREAAVLSAADRADPELADAEARRNAVRSLCAVTAALPPGELPAEAYCASADTLLCALSDYAVDKRGDVGSFVREAVLQSLPSFVDCGLRYCDSDGDSAVAVAERHVAFLQAVVRLLLEKLDRVRVAAGAALAALLSHDSLGRGVVDRDERLAGELAALRAFLAGGQLPEWATTAEVITRLTPVLLKGCPALLSAAAMEGLVISAGDRAEHMSRPALRALLAAFTVDAEAEAERGRLSALVVAVGAQHAHEERVLVPLSRALDHLLTHGALSLPAHAAAVELLRAELRFFSTNIVVLLPLVTLLGTLCRSPCAAARHSAWSLALTMVASRYPKVRAKMATDLYTSLLVVSTGNGDNGDGNSDGRQDLDGAMQFIAHTQWDSSDAVAVRSARNRLYAMLGVEAPAATAAAAAAGGDGGTGKRAGAAAEKVAASYSALVQEAGY